MKLITVELDLLIDDRINLDVLKKSYLSRAALANMAADEDAIEHRYLDIRITEHRDLCACLCKDCLSVTHAEHGHERKP